MQEECSEWSRAGAQRSGRGPPTAFSVRSLLPVWPSVYITQVFPNPEVVRPGFYTNHELLLGQGRWESLKGMRLEASFSDKAREQGYK